LISFHIHIGAGERFGAGTEVRHPSIRFLEQDCTDDVKVAGDGLVLRCDGPSFETAVANVSLSSGKWYYEVHLDTDGKFQIGWASKRQCRWNPQKSIGVGDDKFSFGIDLFTLRFWHDDPHEVTSRKWKVGDVIGCSLDLDAGTFSFSLNGQNIALEFKSVPECQELSPAVSVGSFQRCRVNFGEVPFAHAPPRTFKAVALAKPLGSSSSSLSSFAPLRVTVIVGVAVVVVVGAAYASWYLINRPRKQLESMIFLFHFISYQHPTISNNNNQHPTINNTV